MDLVLSPNNYRSSIDTTVSFKGSNIAVAWINLTFYGKSGFKNQLSPILCQLKGKVNFGEITALMGSSGAGKTSLLRCIYGLNRNGLSRQSEIYESKYEQLYPRFIVQDQKDHLLMKLTTRESLTFSSKLKNNNKTIKYIDQKLYHKRKVDKLLVEFMLNDCADTMVSKCSGGEQKRLVIALELTSEVMPNLICIDEPTSGLDSNAAEKVIQCLRKVAHNHQLAIVTSIHQPSTDVLMTFNQLYVLAKGGRCVYFGPPNKLNHHLKECKIVISKWQKPVEVLLKISSKKNKEMIEKLGIECVDLGPPDEVVRLMIKTYEDMESLNSECKINCTRSIFGLQSNDRWINLNDMWHLFWRFFIYSWIRKWKENCILFVVFMAVAFVIPKVYPIDVGLDASCLNDILNDTNKSLHIKIGDSHAVSNIKFLFFLFVFMMFVMINATVLTYSLEIKVFFNEHRNQWYSTASFYWAKTMVETPLPLITCYFYVYVGFYLTSQPEMNNWYNIFNEISERLALVLAFFLLSVLSSQGMAIFCGIIFVKNFRLAAVFAITLFLFMTFFSGFLCNLRDLNEYAEKLTYLSFIKVSFQSILIIIFGRNRCPNSISSVLIAFHISDDELWDNFWWCLGHAIAWKVLPLVVLMIKANPNWFSKVKNIKKAYGYHVMTNQRKSQSVSYPMNSNGRSNSIFQISELTDEISNTVNEKDLVIRL